VSGGTVAVLGLLSLLAAGVVLEVAARRRRDLPSAAQAIGAAMRTTPGRAAVLVTWLWLGVHFLAR
jgi:hypothetical protein